MKQCFLLILPAVYVTRTPGELIIIEAPELAVVEESWIESFGIDSWHVVLYESRGRNNARAGS
jgi:hypothetical protein